ncbi:MAG TPA: pilus assembly protein TadG-related protein [Devosia sp.]|uniref:pilus assembly protein TadG-related protein n=1 Tax=Devosia sp. TaxID=1871048 RepID=UPI002F94240D
MRFTSLLRRFGRDESGVFAVIFGLMAIVLVAMGGAVVDYVALEQTRNRAQIALDAAALALQPEITKKDYKQADILERAEDLVLKQIGDASISAKVDGIRIDQARGSLFLSGEFTTATNFVRLVGIQELTASFSSEAVRGALDIEVAVALDITGSMSGTRIADLQAAAKTFVNSIVQNDQTQNKSRMALVPYSQAVNVAPYQASIRGPERAAKPLSKLEWTSGAEKAVTAEFSNGLVTIASTNHGYANDDWVYLWNVSVSSVNARPFQVTNSKTNSFQLAGTNERPKNDYTRSARIIKCLYPGCDVKVTSAKHGFSNGEYIHVTNVGGMTGLNNKTFQIGSVTTDTLVLLGSAAGGDADRRSYTTGTGNLHCTWQSAAETCTYYRFATATGGWQTFAVTSCVTERAANAATDAAFTTTFAGRNYPASNNPCVANRIVPLTADKTALTNAINAFDVEGSTAGQLGIVWAWHMLSPNLGYLWPNNAPSNYKDPKVFKAAIIMTDGDFNTVHCNGVIARNSTSGSGNDSEKINCDAHNGDAYTQARAYCDAMKKTQSIEIFTVGFGITTGSAAQKLLTYCASKAEYALLTNNSSELTAAFAKIAANISALRIAQ